MDRSYCKDYNIDERLIELFETSLKTVPLYRKLIEDFNKIINVLERNNKNLLTKVEIANNTGLGYTSVINKIKFLSLYGFIYLKSNGVYEVIDRNIEKATPFTIMADIGILKSYIDFKEENITRFISNLLSVDEVDVLKAQGYLTYLTKQKRIIKKDAK